MPIFNVKQWAIAFVITIIFIVWDVTDRLNFYSVNTPKHNNKISSLIKKETKVSTQELQQIVELFSQYDRKEKLIKPKAIPKKIVKKGLSTQQQLKQHGLLDNLYVDNQKYILKGIFTEKAHFAVLYRENINSGIVDEYKVKVGQKLGPYNVASISYSQVKFTRDKNTIILSIF